MASEAPSFKRKGDVFDRLDGTIIGVEADGKLADFKQIGSGHFFSERVSDAWRSASPAR